MEIGRQRLLALTISRSEGKQLILAYIMHVDLYTCNRTKAYSGFGALSPSNRIIQRTVVLVR